MEFSSLTQIESCYALAIGLGNKNSGWHRRSGSQRGVAAKGRRALPCSHEHKDRRIWRRIQSRLQATFRAGVVPEVCRLIHVFRPGDRVRVRWLVRADCLGLTGIVLDVQPNVFLGLGRHVASVEIRPKVYGI